MASRITGCAGDGGRPFPGFTPGGHGGHGVERFGNPDRREAGVINVEFGKALSRMYYCRTPRSMSSIPTA
jgi:hypothetical protein